MGYIHFDKNRIKSIFNAEDSRAVVIVSDEREKPFSNIKRIIKGYDKFVKITIFRTEKSRISANN